MLIAHHRIRWCFFVTGALGLWLVAFGLIVEPLAPHFQLDHVLTAEQLKDPKKLVETLEILQTASGNRWAILSATGAAIFAASIVGRSSLSDRRPE